MATLTHEEIAELFRSDPELAVDLLRRTRGVHIPRFDHLEVKPGDLVELVPIAYRADVVVLLVAGEPVFVIILEVQLAQDADKRFSWPYYAAAAHARYRCPACLIVYAPDPAVARWAARPIHFGQPGSPFKPLVRGPKAIPRITGAAAAARAPYRAVLSVVAHGREPEGETIARAALQGIAGLPEDERATWEEVILASLDIAARRALEEWMNLQGYPEKSTFYQRGKAEGEAKALLAVLTARGLRVSDELRARILAAAEVSQLEAWIVRAATAASIDEVFATTGR